MSHRDLGKALCSALLLSLGVSLASGQTLDHLQRGTTHEGVSLGSRVVSIDDVNGDGVEDYLYGHGGLDRHYVRSGADWSLLASVHAPSPGFGHAGHGGSVSAAGDWDADGIGDYAVGAAGFSPNGGASFMGNVRIYSGATHAELVQILEPIPLLGLGARVFGLGDITGDGWPELAVIGVPNDHKVRIYSAPSGTLLRTHLILTYHFHVETYGDWDGDGNADYMVTNINSTPTVASGSVEMFSGATGLHLTSFEGTEAYDAVGISFSKGGDWNADGIEDVVVGAPGTPLTEISIDSPLEVYVYSGADGSILRTFEGLDYSTEVSNFGYCVDSGFDVNGDGFPDIIVGAPGYSFFPGGATAGALYVISGRTGTMLWRQIGPSHNTKYGEYVAFLPDRNGDGLAEWLVADLAAFPVDSYFAIYQGAEGDAWNLCTSHSSGAGQPEASLRTSGPISLRENAFGFSLESAPADTAVFLFAGSRAPAMPFGQGELCVAGTPFRVRAGITDSTGAAALPVDLWQPPFGPGPNQLFAGATHAFQLVYRNPVSSQVNTTNSVAVKFLP